MATFPFPHSRIVFLPIILDLLTLKYLRDRKKKKKQAEKKSKLSGTKKSSGRAKLKLKLSLLPALVQ